MAAGEKPKTMDATTRKMKNNPIINLGNPILS
jgi:hypothetical protein